MIGVYGVVPPYQGCGRPPTHKQPQPGWQYLQVVKHRDAHDHLEQVELRVIFGDEAEVLALLGYSTAYIERTHLTMRLFNGRLTRKTLAFSTRLAMYRAAVTWEDLVYNLARPLKTLRMEVFDDPHHRWQPRSPAMAAGLTDYIWIVKELLTAVIIPNNT